MHETTLRRKQPIWDTEDNYNSLQRGFAFLTSKSSLRAWGEKKGELGRRRKKDFDEFAEDLGLVELLCLPTE